MMSFMDSLWLSLAKAKLNFDYIKYNFLG